MSEQMNQKDCHVWSNNPWQGKVKDDKSERRLIQMIFPCPERVGAK